MGPIGVKKHLAPFLPSHPVVSTFFLVMDDIVYNIHTCLLLYSLEKKKLCSLCLIQIFKKQETY